MACSTASSPISSDDTDGDGLINALDPDSDNDGLFDGTELGQGCSNADTNVTAGNCIPDDDADDHHEPADCRYGRRRRQRW